MGYVLHGVGDQDGDSPSHLARRKWASAVALNLSSLSYSPETFICIPDAVLHVCALLRLLLRLSPPSALCD